MNIEEGIFTQKELHFMTKHESILIKPNFISGKMVMVSGTFGPFKAGVVTEVPIWLALYLKKRGKCIVILPETYDIENLRDKLKQESESKREMVKLPGNFFGIFDVLANSAKDDIEDFDEVRSMVDDLKQKRMAKLSQRIQKMELSDKNFEEFDYKNYTEQELQMNRSLLGEMLQKVNKIKDLQKEKKNESGDNFVSQF